MDADALAKQLLADPRALEQLAEPLPDHIAEAVIVRLRAEAEAYWWVNANRSLEMADLIVAIGRRRDDRAQTALGLMTRGDALKLLGQTAEAWDTLDQAGNLFLAVDDEFGWARSRIGRLAICVDLNRVAEALEEAQHARDIFVRHSSLEKVMRLELNLAIVHGSLGQYGEALALFYSALETAEALGDEGRSHLGLLHTDIGHVYELLGDLQRALAHHDRALVAFTDCEALSGVALAESNKAYIAMRQGHYRRALQLLHRVQELYIAEDLRLDATHTGRALVECYLLLNRFSEARNLAEDVSSDYKENGASYYLGLTLVHLATAESALGNLAAAEVALDMAQPIFESLDAKTWAATVIFRRGRIALHRGDLAAARQAATVAAAAFKATGQQVDYAQALVLAGQISLANGDTDAAATFSGVALAIACKSNVPELRYTAHVLLGRVAEAEGHLVRAQRRYQAATATVDRVQRALTITLRPGFLEDKGEALRALIALHLRAGEGRKAIEALECTKSQALLSYLADRGQLHWAKHDRNSRTLVEEFSRLREEHHWLYRLAHDQPGEESEPRNALTPQQALEMLAGRERRMRSISEQLYLAQSDDQRTGRAGRFSLKEVQQQLEPGTMLVEYYDDGARLWAFSVDSRGLEVHPLPMGLEALNGLVRQLQVNIGAALKMPGTSSMTRLAQRILQRLYAALLEPLAPRVAGCGRLLIVPYGALHYLPFHLLHNGEDYVIERHEIVVLPSAGLATRQAPRRTPGLRVLAHSWNGRLPHATAEGQLVQQLFGGELYKEANARRSCLGLAPTQVLHIAAHGEHRIDQPDLSYVELADGQMYTDDLLQHDLSYELVVLSACETGRARVTAGDELIGLGRGFLYAGAGALVTSLWQVIDDITVPLMRHMYSGLQAGESKAASLRNAQRAVLFDNPQLHPALWGAFQLVGDAMPLSGTVNTRAKETLHEQPTVGAR